VRSARTRLAGALSDWETRLNFLRKNPVGSNYDFTGVALAGLVVTPLLLFTDHPGASTEAVHAPGFLNYLALPELEATLRQIRSSRQ
jgi:hypothetical protein